jgi:putative two-component system response regulator
MDNMEETGKHATVLVRPTVMVVDDADEMLMIMESILAKEYSLKLFNNPKEALDYASSNPPDLILLDVMMPDIDGFEACRRLKTNPKLRDIPVIFLTSKDEDEYEEMGFSVGASDFIHKPINAPIVTARVKTHLKIKFVMDYMRNENLRLQKTAKEASTEVAELTKMLWGSPFVKS